MKTKSVIECEQVTIERMMKKLLPNSFKKIGSVLFFIFLTALLVNSFTVSDPSYKILAKYGMLVGLLIISISKEKFEDELVREIRMQSFSFAFIVAVLYTLALPIVDYAVDLLLRPDTAGFNEAGDFKILWMLLICKVGYFELLKKIHR